MDLAVPKPELTVWMATVHGGPHVAKTVQHVPEQGGKTRAVQPITTKPSVGSEGGVGVVVHLSKNKGEMNQHFNHQTEATNQNSKQTTTTTKR
jgi:hypothetical protein